MDRLTDRELHCLTDLCRRAVDAKPDYRQGQQVLSALEELKEARNDTEAIAKIRALKPENMACDFWSKNMGFPVEQIEDILEELDAAREAGKGGA